MVSGRQMSELLKLADQQSSRIIFSGDTKQIRSVEASDALRVLERESHLKSVSLSEVQRQTAQGYREAIQELRRDPERGFDKLEQIGAVREAPGRTGHRRFNKRTQTPRLRPMRRAIYAVCWLSPQHTRKLAISLRLSALNAREQGNWDRVLISSTTYH